MALRTATGSGVAGIGETALRALVKLEQVLPARLRHQVNALQVSSVPAHTAGPTVDAEVLTTVGTACRDHRQLRFDYLGHGGEASTRTTEPHQLVTWGPRWYLVAWDLDREDWRTFRVDRIQPRPPTGPRFTPRALTGGDAAAHVTRGIAQLWPYRATIRLHTPAHSATARAAATYGSIEPIDDHTCLLHAGADTPRALAFLLGALDVDFHIQDAPALATHLQQTATRYHRATLPPGETLTPPCPAQLRGLPNHLDQTREAVTTPARVDRTPGNGIVLAPCWRLYTGAVLVRQSDAHGRDGAELGDSDQRSPVGDRLDTEFHTADADLTPGRAVPGPSTRPRPHDKPSVFSQLHDHQRATASSADRVYSSRRHHVQLARPHRHRRAIDLQLQLAIEHKQCLIGTVALLLHRQLVHAQDLHAGRPHLAQSTRAPRLRQTSCGCHQVDHAHGTPLPGTRSVVPIGPAHQDQWMLRKLPDQEEEVVDRLAKTATRSTSDAHPVTRAEGPIRATRPGHPWPQEDHPSQPVDLGTPTPMGRRRRLAARLDTRVRTTTDRTSPTPPDLPPSGAPTGAPALRPLRRST